MLGRDFRSSIGKRPPVLVAALGVVTALLGVSGQSLAQPTVIAQGDPVRAQDLNLWTTLGVVAAQLSLDAEQANRVEVMDLYRVDDLTSDELNAVLNFLSESRPKDRQPSVVLVVDDTTTSAENDFVAQPASWTQAPSVNQWAEFVRDARNLVSPDDQAPTQGDAPLYFAIDGDVAPLDPTASVVFFDGITSRSP